MKTCARCLVALAVVGSLGVALGEPPHERPQPRVPPGLPPPACVQSAPEQVLERITHYPAGDAETARCIVRHQGNYSPLLLRPAVAVLEAAGDADSLERLTKLVTEVHPADELPPDATTRAVAARAIGLIVAKQRSLDPAYDVPGAVRNRLSECLTTRVPSIVLHGCIRAASDGRMPELAPALEGVLAGADPLARLAAAQALTRLTGEERITASVAAQAVDRLAEILATP